MTAPALREPGGILGGRSSFGMCGMVCWPLQGFLYGLGVRSRLEEVELEGEGTMANHCFLRLPDGRILDPTAANRSWLTLLKSPPALH